MTFTACCKTDSNVVNVDVIIMLLLLIVIGFIVHVVNFQIVVPPPQESMDNGPSLFDYGLDDPYDDLIDDFDPYLE